MIKLAILGAVAVLILYNVVKYRQSTGTVAERLAAAWKGSMTLFVGVVATVASVLTSGMDVLAQLTGDPLFSQWSQAVAAVIPPTWQPLIPIAGLTATMLARLRTAGK